MGDIKRLRRSHLDALIGGVCAGIGRYTGIDPVLVRLGWVVITFLGGAGLLMYLLAWAIISDDEGRHTVMPVLLVALIMVLPLLGLLYFLPVSVTRTP